MHNLHKTNPELIKEFGTHELTCCAFSVRDVRTSTQGFVFITPEIKFPFYCAMKTQVKEVFNHGKPGQKILMSFALYHSAN